MVDETTSGTAISEREARDESGLRGRAERDSRRRKLGTGVFKKEITEVPKAEMGIPLVPSEQLAETLPERKARLGVEECLYQQTQKNTGTWTRDRKTGKIIRIE